MLARLRERSEAESGFTLIELLVVMIIIAILMAVAVPTFLSQKNTAVKTKATANVKQIVNAIESCATQLPSGGYTDGTLNCLLPATLNQIEPTLTSLGIATGAPAVNGYQVVADGLAGYAVVTQILDAGQPMRFAEIHKSDGSLLKICGANVTATSTAGTVSTTSKTCRSGKW